GGLWAEDRCLLIVELDRVLVDPVFDADTFWAIFELADDFTAEGAVNLATQKAHHVTAPEASDGVMGQRRIDALQSRSALEDNVARPLTLVHGPVVGEGKVLEDVVVQRVEHAGDAIEQPWPAGAQLPVHQALRLGEVGDLDEAVVSAFVGQACVVHLAGEPLAAVDADLDAEWEPGLDPSIHEAEHGIDDVVIVVQALAELGPDLERSGLWVRAQAEGAARL